MLDIIDTFKAILVNRYLKAIYIIINNNRSMDLLKHDSPFDTLHEDRSSVTLERKEQKE